MPEIERSGGTVMVQVGTPPTLTSIEVDVAMRRLPGFKDATLIAWTQERITGGGGECLGVWRVSGDALTGVRIQPWSIILKGWGAPVPGSHPSDWDWSLREVEIYRSGLLHNLPGDFRAPAYFGDIEQEDGSVWMWLEDVAGDRNEPWPLERYAEVARQLGQFNGTWLVDRPLPEHPFLSRDWLRKWVEPSAEFVPLLQREAHQPEVQETYPPDVATALVRMWNDRHASYALLRQLPQTFCHLDVFRRNIFDPYPAGSSGKCTLIDWSFSGVATIGEELAALVGASFAFMEVPAANIKQLEGTALAAYIAGLNDVGWQGDPELARAGYRASVGLRYGVSPLRFILPQILAGSMSPETLEMLGHPEDEVRANFLAFNIWVTGAASRM
jgi:hypothetical protein